MNTKTPIDIPTIDENRKLTAINAAIDGGLPVNKFRDLVNLNRPHLSSVKFGWGSGIITNCLGEKIEILKDAGIHYWFGGTLFEIAHQQNNLDKLLDWCEEMEVTYFEISDGTIELDEQEKCQLISRLSERFGILSEVGSKDVNKVMSPSEWTRKIKNEMEAGSKYVIAEGRESGTVGVYRGTGEVRSGLIQELEEKGVDFERMIFEAPKKSQQIWFMGQIGRFVNLGNLAMDDVLNVECLRLGLRGDTIDYSLVSK